MTRPPSIPGYTKVIKTGCGKLYGTLSNKEEKYQEAFFRLGKCGGCASAFLDGIGRLISLGLNEKLTWDLVHRAFQSIRCSSPTYDGNIQVLSCLDGIAKLLKEEKTNEPTDKVE